jgi:Ser/Thr protein kinase RdoA (MazF antagonist)
VGAGLTVGSDFAALGQRARARRLAGLARVALAAYGLEAARIALLAVGFTNATFRVEAPGGPCVLRVQGGARRAEEVRSEMQWLAALGRDTALGVPEPVPTRDGELLTVAATEGVPEPRICALFRWMPGRFVRKGLRPAHLERVGAFTARLHEHALGFAPPRGFMRPPVGALSEAEVDRAVRVVAAHASAARVLEVALAKSARALEGIEDEPGQVGLIHADLHQSNYLFHDREVRAIDFDDCGVGPLLYDPAVTLNTLGARPNLAELRAALLRGYRSVRPLPRGTETRLDALIAVRMVQDIPGVLAPDEDPATSPWLAQALAPLPWLRAYAET